MTTYTKLRSFQYRLLHHALITNLNLFRWKIVQSPLCTFCDLETEDIIHLLYECPIVKKLWKNIEMWLKNKNVNINFTLCEIIFNSFHENVINLICTIIKQYIYRSRCFKVKPNINETLKIINEIHSIYKNIAIVQNKIKAHEKKWLKIYT